ncbi:MAG: hypothetical protein GX620_16065, partial [Chloroflexi bacterium]|nr:hypothetical protein [Chloroflexota bacterium]
MSGVRLNSRTARWATVLFLLLMFSVALRSARYASATYDEFVYIARGYTYLSTGETWLKVRHPILIDVLAAAPLRLLSDVRLPPADPAWATRDIYLYAYEFMWELNDHQADQIIYLSRLPIILLTVVLSAGVFRWASESAGFIAGLVSSVLCCLDPNLLAHARLVTPDAGQTTFIFLSALAWWRYLQRPTAKRWLIAGVALGVAQAAGFPALILFPVLAAASLTWGWSAGRARGALDHLVSLGAASLVALAVLWAIYGFRWGPVDGLGLSLPAPYHWEELVSLLQRLQRRDLAYCCGEVYRGGRWDFFVVALFTKTPLPTLAFCSLGVFAIVRQKRCIRDSALWMLPATYYGNALISELNIGYRHILPILPFVFIIGGQSIGLVRARWQKIVWIGLLGWLAVASLSAHPFYLTYFNELVGGPSGGKDFLVVSDLDWGQDLPGLQVYLDERQVDEVYLSWFGTTPPEHYGIEYRPLPAWPPRGLPTQLPYHPVYPLPGAYAISAANLVGARLSQPDTFVWFRMRQPQATIGHSIYIYEVPRLLDVDAAPANVLLSGALLADLP